MLLGGHRLDFSIELSVRLLVSEDIAREIRILDPVPGPGADDFRLALAGGLLRKFSHRFPLAAGECSAGRLDVFLHDFFLFLRHFGVGLGLRIRVRVG
jgi:hypothetical protein